MIQRALLAAAVIVATALPASAGNCWWTAPPSTVGFGAVSAFAAPAQTAATFSIRCTPFTGATVKLSRGSASASVQSRTMLSPSGSLDYLLTKDAAGTMPWGDGSDGTTVFDVFNGSPEEKNFNVVIYARIAAGGDPQAGTYSDTVTAILSWGNGPSDARPFTVQATVVAECVVSAFAVDFGYYDPLVAHASRDLDASAPLLVVCTKGTTASVTLSRGQNGDRRMRSGAGGTLSYSLFSDPSRAVSWTEATPQRATSRSRIEPLNGGFVVFGRVDRGQDAARGTYADTVVAVVNY
jgi:spore coat protein U-like protein